MSALDFAVKPNPGTRGLNIRFSDKRKEAVDVVLLNIDGRKVFEFEVETGNTCVDLLNIPHSIYILQVYDKQGNMKTFKLIKS
jgi:hypothetical protein